MSNLLIEFAFDECGCVVHPFLAVVGRDYFCPSCREPLIVKSGNIKTRHFSHLSKSSCSGESYLHYSAKHGVANLINVGLPVYLSVSALCGRHQHCYLIINRPGDRALVEHSFEGFVYDVFVVSSLGEPKFAVEVCYSHPCSDKKINNTSLPIIEVEVDYIKGNNSILNFPLIYKFPRFDKYLSSLPPCPFCELFCLGSMSFSDWSRAVDDKGAFLRSMWGSV